MGEDRYLNAARLAKQRYEIAMENAVVAEHERAMQEVAAKILRESKSVEPEFQEIVEREFWNLMRKNNT
jgi:oligoendopeptidase F